MECPHLPQMNYGDFSQQLHDRSLSRRIPLVGSVELTARCNLNCAHCYINLPSGHEEARKQELTLAQWRRLLDEMVEEGCLWLLLTGGEVLVRPDFLEIYTYAKQRGMLLTLFTNGTLISEPLADHLARWRPFDIQISLYGRTRETYEAVTRVPGSYDRCLRGIQLLVERQLPLSLKSMATTLNYHEIKGMQEWSESLGLKFFFDPALNPRLDGGQGPCRLRLSPEEVVALDQADEKRSQEWRGLCERFVGPHDDDNLYRCYAGINAFHIDAYGQLSLCMMVRNGTHNLRQRPFKEAWANLYQVRDQKREPQSPCNRCDLVYLCDNCPGWAQLETGDPESSVDFLCKIAQLRARVFAGKLGA
jgi:radical SAM protein with 4Fe4S-binding SPASM domain